MTLRLFQLEDAGATLDAERDGRARLTAELTALRAVEKSVQRLERAKRSVEQDFQDYKVREQDSGYSNLFRFFDGNLSAVDGNPAPPFPLP